MPNRKIYDISRTISPKAAIYPGDDPLRLDEVAVIGKDAPCNITALGGWTTHFLTHVDPPRHFVTDGTTLAEIPLTRFIGDCLVVEVDAEAISSEHVPEEIEGKSILFKTRNSSADPGQFDESHVFIDKTAVDVLIQRAPNLVGIDYLSVDRFGDEDYPAHRGLLGHNILILEGLDLSTVSPGSYELLALPLKIEDGDGSPTRAILISDE